MARSLSADDYRSIVEAVASSRQTLEHYRQARRDRIELYAGADYSEETGPVPRPLNLVRQYVDVFGRSLVAKSPRVMLSTFSRRQKPAVRACQDWLNQHAERTDLAATLRRATIDALFQVGVVKVALATPGDAALFPYAVEPGDPYACCVSLHDLVYDTFAQSRESLQFIGHWVRVPIDAVKDHKVYGPGRRELEPTDRPRYTADGDEMAHVLSGWASRGTHREAFPMVDLLELFLPRQRRWLTFAGDRHGEVKLHKDGPLRDVPYSGPRNGPFHWLGFGWVPDCVMPAGTVATLTDLDVAANDSFRKLWRQAQRMKMLDLVQKSRAEDGQAIRTASDGDLVPVEDPNAVVKLVTGGPDPNLVGFLGVLRELFNYMGGNVATVGGLSAQADTATQEKLLAGSASAGVSDMQAEVVRFTTDVFKSLGYYFWENPFKVMETEYRDPALPGPIRRRVYPGGAVNGRTGRLRELTREIPWELLDLKVDPYSVGYQTPGQRAGKLRSLFTQLVAPVWPLLKEQGLSFDMAEFMRNLGEYEDEPAYAELMGLADPPDPAEQQSGGGGGDQSGSGMPISTTRRYERSDSGPKKPGMLEQMAKMGTPGAQRNGTPSADGGGRY